MLFKYYNTFFVLKWQFDSVHIYLTDKLTFNTLSQLPNAITMVS